jgi:glucosamine--fructose-6-phosphate aminotransferase (isomerizing)
MAGVIGILSAGPAAARLTQVLPLLGRGAAGVALLAEGAIARPNVQHADEIATCAGRSGVAFATGAEPRSASPRSSGKVAAATAGVIRNARALKRRLIAAGRPLADGGDIIEELITLYLERGHAPEAAVTAALPHLQGDFSVVFLFAGEDDLLIGAARGAPLAAGFSAQDVCLSSSSAALAGLACQAHKLEHGDLAILSRTRLSIIDSDGMRMERAAPRLVWSGEPTRAPARLDAELGAAADVRGA